MNVYRSSHSREMIRPYMNHNKCICGIGNEKKSRFIWRFAGGKNINTFFFRWVCPWLSNNRTVYKNCFMLYIKEKLIYIPKIIQRQFRYVNH